MGVVRHIAQCFDKVEVIRDDAQRAWAGPNRVYAPRLPLPMGSRGNVLEWADQIEAIESIGWVMQSWAVASNDYSVLEENQPLALPLFRRPPAAA